MTSAPVFAALGDETRLQLVARLSEGGPQSIAQLTTGTAFTRQAITKHLNVLADAGLVRGSRSGRESRWEFEPQRLVEAGGYLDLISQQWDKRLAALKQHIEGKLEAKAGREK
jgi:DNA-binding transcriptional ArsR family regulator